MDVFTALNVKGPLTVAKDGTNVDISLTDNSTALEITPVILQDAAQSDSDDAFIKVETYAPKTGSTDPGDSTDVAIPGQLYINTTTGTTYVYNGENSGNHKVFIALGNPSFENTIEHISIDGTEVTPTTISGVGAKTVDLGAAAGYDISSSIASGSTGLVTGSTVYTELSTNYVPNTTTVNGHALSSNVTVTLPDILGANTDIGADFTFVYVDNGTIVAGTPLYQKTISINNTSTDYILSTSSTFSLNFYAPTSSGSVTGTVPEYLVSGGSGNAPVWCAPITAYGNMSSGSSTFATTGAIVDYVDHVIGQQPTPMVYKGTVGSGGTISWSAWPPSNPLNGWTYLVVSDHSSSPVCQVGDTLIYNGSTWDIVPSGDEPDGTVVSVSVGSGLTVTSYGTGSSSSEIVDSGTIEFESGYGAFHISDSINTIDSTLSSDNDTITLGSVPSGMKPRIVQLYNSSGEEVYMDVQIGSGTGNLSSITITSAAGFSGTLYYNVVCW